MNIILFGGSFNPPHLGHQIVISQAFELIPRLASTSDSESRRAKIDQLWLLPDYKHAFAKGENFASPKHRLAMTKMLETKNVRTKTCCFDHKLPGNTIFHITHLKKAYPKHQFSFLMGSDNLPTFHKWPKYKTLLKLMPFYIYPRACLRRQAGLSRQQADHPFKPLYRNMHPLKHPLQIITNISSDTVRNRLKKGLSINHLLPEKIANYISKHNLYL